AAFFLSSRGRLRLFLPASWARDRGGVVEVTLTAHELLGDRGGRVAVEVGQQAVDGVQHLVAGDPAGERRAHHAAEKLVDIGGVLVGAEGHEHLGAGAVPAGGDRLHGEQHADVRGVLDALRGDVVDHLAGQVAVRVGAEDVGDVLRAQLGPLVVDDVQDLAEVVVRGLVRHLHHQQRDHGVGLALFDCIRSPSLGGGLGTAHCFA
ncbi:hypothetical protein DOS77_10205, partial [Staphylococcus felis]